MKSPSNADMALVMKHVRECPSCFADARQAAADVLLMFDMAEVERTTDIADDAISTMVKQINATAAKVGLELDDDHLVSLVATMYLRVIVSLMAKTVLGEVSAAIGDGPMPVQLPLIPHSHGPERVN